MLTICVRCTIELAIVLRGMALSGEHVAVVTERQLRRCVEADRSAGSRWIVGVVEAIAVGELNRRV